jgi:4-amino-4-deoxy-L-arabinose transferase-like glycosyltransferase
MPLPTPSVRVLLILAALSLLPMLNLHYIGEEAIFPISSMEMAQHGVWLKQYLYGGDVQHNPLFNWLIIPLSNLAGWTHVLQVARSLAIMATLGTAAVLAWLTWRLFGQKQFAAFSALVYLTFVDVMMYHGWLAYVDPLFGFFIFSSIALLWVACTDNRPRLLWLVVATLTCALLSKAFTAYVFYGAAVFVMLLNTRGRRLLFSLQSLAAHTAMLAAPILWFAMIPSGHGQSGRMFDEILAKLTFPEATEYLTRLALYPLELLTGLLPASALAIYFLIRRRVTFATNQPNHFRTALLIAGLNLLPYWLSPHGGMRYLIPIYPLFALSCAWIIWQAGEAAQGTTRRWLTAAILFCFALGLVIFPYYQQKFRGENYALAANEIVAITHGQPIYTADPSSAGLNVTAYINQLRYPQQALQYPPAQWENGFVLARTANPELGAIHSKFQLLGDELYLLCRGTACQRQP